MERNRFAGFFAGVLVGALLSPVVCLLLYLATFLLGLFSIIPNSPIRPLYELLAWLGSGLYVMPIALVCGGLGFLGFCCGPGIFVSREIG